MKLSDLKRNQSASILSIEESDFSLKLFEFGLLPDAEISIINKAPFNGPIYVSVGQNLISLRREEASTVFVK
ncbi:MAG: FeoA family protein [Crocinitomicaceae bacterium]